MTVKDENAAKFEEIVTDAVKIGTVTDTDKIIITTVKMELTGLNGTVEEFRSAWKGAIPCLLNSEA